MPLAVSAQESNDDSISLTREQDIERAATIAVENCTAEIEQFCGDVTPGESRVLACLQSYADKVSPNCEQSIGKWRGPDLERDFQTTRIYPTLENRELGKPNLAEDGERVIWKYKLPFLAQQVLISAHQALKTRRCSSN
jgi:hypothetical protein